MVIIQKAVLIWRYSKAGFQISPTFKEIELIVYS